MTPADASTVVVVGAGHSGLSTAAALARRGIPVVILERTDTVGSTWRNRYEALRLNTERWGSALPGLTLGTGGSRWPSTAEFADYLGRYAEHHQLRPRFGVQVERVTPGPSGTARILTSDGALEASAVVLATGPDQLPQLPDWPGQADFRGSVLHAADYRRPGPFAGHRVLVVGGGESGADIALDLARGGARQVWLSVRPPPYIVKPDLLRLPAQRMAILARSQPAAVFDLNAEVVRRYSVGDLSAYGLGRPPSLHDSARVRGKAPILDRGFLDAIRQRTIHVISAVTAVRETTVLLADGQSVEPDAIIAATGYAPGLDPLVGHLGLLGPTGMPAANAPKAPANQPALFFAGYAPVLTGAIREAGRISRQTARQIQRYLISAPKAPRGSIPG